MNKAIFVIALLSGLLYGNQTMAQTLVPGELVIYEYQGTGVAGPARPFYIVANGTDRDISAFGVTNMTMGNSTQPDQAGWRGAAIKNTQWDDGETLAIMSAWLGLHPGVVSSGSFSHNFGDTNSMVNFYWNVNGAAIRAGEVSQKFFYNGIWLSEFKAWDTTGQAIYEHHRSAIHAVPEPAAWALMLIGLGIVLTRQRLRN